MRHYKVPARISQGWYLAKLAENHCERIFVKFNKSKWWYPLDGGPMALQKGASMGSPFKRIVVQGACLQTLQISLILGFLLQPHLSTRYLEENPHSF